MPQFPGADARNPLAADCQRCPALVESRECISWGNGSLDATLVVVGEAPAAGDPDADRWRGGNWTGMAYTSRHSGRRIRDLLAGAGYGHDDCYFTNAVKCFPSDGSASETTDGSPGASDGGTERNREPTAEERANCRPYLRAEIETVAPAVVVTTGKHATSSALAFVDRDLDGFLEAVLEPIPCPSFETTLLPLLHPSYQNIWIPRIGHTPESYREALSAVLDSETTS